MFSMSPPPPPPVSTGKIYGKITDDEDGSSLAGANVTLKGTNFGAATDQYGNYYITNVPPGIYTLEASMLGYRSGLVQNVRVAVMDSSEENLKLKPITLENEEVIIVAPDKKWEPNPPRFELLNDQSTAASSPTPFKNTGKIRAAAINDNAVISIITIPNC